MGYTIDIDTGGTFTDGFFVHGEEVSAVKVPTTPHDLTVCFIKCIEAGAAGLGLAVEDLLYDTEVIRFSNTIGTNTIIQRDGSKVGLIVTSGSESLAPSSNGDGKAPLVQPEMVAGVKEEVSSEGSVLMAPDISEVLAKAQGLIDAGARCLVVALANSQCSPENEKFIRNTIKDLYPRDYLGSIPVFISSDVTRRPGQAERINAAVLNAYIHGKLVRLLYKAGEELRQRMYPRNLFIVHNNGAVARVAKTRAINTYNSGPAAGLLGARLIGELYGDQDLISADMGGTSFDLGYIRQGQPSYTLVPDVEGFHVNLPMLSIRALGAGGGSIASANDGQLQVGPQSAGAMPGPVCFDLGGDQPTVTDADVVLGLLDPDYFLGGEMKLNADKAREVLSEKVAAPLGVSVEEAALAIKKKIDAAMGQGLKGVKESVGDGFDPTLVVYGGAGPAHCCDIASHAGVKKIIITPYSAIFSAFSSLSMDVGHQYYRRIEKGLGDSELEGAVSEAVAAMQKEALRDMRGEGFSKEVIRQAVEFMIRPADGKDELRIAVELGENGDTERLLGQAKTQAAEQLSAPAESLWVSTVGLLAQAPTPHYTFAKFGKAEAPAEDAAKGTRQVYLEGAGESTVTVYDRDKMASGHQLDGPALIESQHTTVFIPTGWGLAVDQYNNLLLEEV